MVFQTVLQIVFRLKPVLSSFSFQFYSSSLIFSSYVKRLNFLRILCMSELLAIMSQHISLKLANLLSYGRQIYKYSVPAIVCYVNLVFLNIYQSANLADVVHETRMWVLPFSGMRMCGTNRIWASSFYYFVGFSACQIFHD